MLGKLALLGALCLCMGQAASFDLTILHTNDVHARIAGTEEKGEYVTQCCECCGPKLAGNTLVPT